MARGTCEKKEVSGKWGEGRYDRYGERGGMINMRSDDIRDMWRDDGYGKKESFREKRAMRLVGRG